MMIFFYYSFPFFSFKQYGAGELKDKTSVTRTIQIKSEHQHFGRRKKATRGGETTQIPHLFFLSFFFQKKDHLSRKILDSKLLNHLGKPAHHLLGARNYGGWKTTFSNSCKSVQPLPTDRGMISTALSHPPVVRALGWLNPKRRAMQCGNGEPRRLGCRL